ncbi:MAG: hypothetical protein ACRDD7_12585 [Peptostreptococcaceae bacterium]
MFEVNGFPNVKQPIQSGGGSGVTTKKLNVSNTVFSPTADGLFEATVTHGLGVEPVNVNVYSMLNESLVSSWTPMGLNQVKITIMEKVDIKVTVVG